MKIRQLTTAIGLTLVSSAVIGAPSTPNLSWEQQKYSFVEVNIDGQGSYKDIVKAKEQVDISIKWNAWSGAGGDSYKVYFDDMVVNEGTLSSGTKSGTVRFPYSKSGRHTLKLALCEGDVCAKSAGKPIVIADTDGGHLPPLAMNVNPNNKDYGIKEGMVTGAYFVEWGIYGRKFDVTKIPAQNLSHLLYGFIPICGPNESLKEIENGNSWRALQKACGGSQDYEVVIHDPWAAVQTSLPGIDSKDPIRGTYAQLMGLKQRYPDLKILPSVGGWTMSDPFHGFVEKKNRDTFVASMKKFLKTWKFYDGVDIDWEFPGGGGPNGNLGDTVNDGPAYVALMQELRAMLDELEAETGREYELSSAIGTGYDKIEDVDYQAASQYMDYIFAMTYDFFGGWNNVTGHQTALYCGSHISVDECNGTGLDDNGEPRKGPAYTLDNAVQLLLEQGVNSRKIVVGAAMYGRGWEGVFDANTTISGNPMTAPGNGKLTGSNTQGVWEAGVMDYKGIATYFIGSNGNGVNGFEAGYDEQAEAAYAWNRSSGKLATFDNARSVKAKGAYVNTHNLGGIFAWEIDADNGDILNAMHEGLDSVTPPNRLPVVNVPASVQVASGESISITANATDADRDTLTYSWSTDSALNLTDTNQATVNVSAPVVTSNSQYTVSVEVFDGTGSVTKEVTVNVLVDTPNRAPVVQPINNVTLNVGQSSAVTAQATDADGDTLSYNWNVPNGLTLAGSGASVTLTGDVASDTPYTVTVTVSDGSLEVTESFTVTVKSDTPPANTWKRNKVYVKGDRVIYKGKNYEAKWWTRGQEPGKAFVWKLL